MPGKQVTGYLLLPYSAASATGFKKGLLKAFYYLLKKGQRALWYQGDPWIWASLHPKEVDSLDQWRILVANKFNESIG